MSGRDSFFTVVQNEGKEEDEFNFTRDFTHNEHQKS